MQKILTSMVLAALLTAGCGGGSSDSPAQPQTQTSSTVAASTQPSGDLAAKAETLAQVVIGGATTDFAVDESLLNSLTGSGLARQDSTVIRNAVAHIVAVGVGQLGVFVTGETAAGPANRVGAQDSSRLITSPLGGTVQVDVSGAVVSAVFKDFHTRRASLTGTCRFTLASGQISSGAYKATLNFDALSLATQAGTFTIVGTADLDRTRANTANGFNIDSLWTSNLKISDTGGGIHTFQHFAAATHAQISSGVLSATQTYDGTLTLENVQGISGTFQISTPTPIRYQGSQQAFPIQSGQLLLAGTGGTVRLTVAGPDQIEIALLTAKGITIVRTVTWSSLGGATSSN